MGVLNGKCNYCERRDKRYGGLSQYCSDKCAHEAEMASGSRARYNDSDSSNPGCVLDPILNIIYLAILIWLIRACM